MKAIFIVALLLAVLSFAAALTVPIDANREECFYEETESGQKVTVSYQVRNMWILASNVFR